MKNFRFFVTAAVCLLTAGSILFAGTTGKIVGTVIDAETKESLPGAVVEILGTNLGANTDLDGRYFMVNVPVGTFAVQARMMGYESVTKTNVKSLMDLTTTINFALKPTVLEVKGITVEAKRQMVIPDATSTSRVVSTREIMAMPNASANNVVANTAGVTSSGGQMNIRGGRSDEMAYFIDGVTVTDALLGQQGAQINTSAIEEVMVITGGFNAEYGEAMSGIVNVVTKEGSDKISAYGQYTTDLFKGSASRNFNKLEASIGGPVPYMKNLAYFVSAELSNTDDIRPCFMPGTYYEHDPDKDYFWADTLRYSQATYDTIWATEDTLDPLWGTFDLGWTGDWADSSDAAWATELQRRIDNGWMRGWKEYDKNYLPHGGYNSYRLQSKVTYKIQPINAKISLGGFANRDQREGYSADWKYHLNGYYSYLQKAYQLNTTWRQQLGKSTFYTVIFNKFQTNTFQGVKDTIADLDRNWWEDYTFLSDADANGDSVYDDYYQQSSNTYDVNNPYGVAGIFTTYGLARLWQKTIAEYWGAKFDITSQIDNHNQVQSGVEFKRHHVFMKNNSLPWSPEPFKDYYDFRPTTGAAYIQDKLEFEGFIVNAGLRLDYLKPDAQKKANYFDLTQSDTTTMLEAEIKYKISPRFGMSYPVSERTVMHVSYGHFFQQPQLQYLYESLQADITRGNSIMGDPDLGVQRTIAYEVGFSQQISNDFAGDITIYYKDIFDLMGTRAVSDAVTGLSYSAYENAEYGNTRGFELTFQKRPGNGIFSGKGSYTLLLAKGTASDPWTAYNYLYNYGTDPATGLPVPLTKTDNYLDFDQRHTFSLTTSFDFDANFGPKLLGFKPLANVSVNLLNNVGSGFPYTMFDRKGVQVGPTNGARMPWTWSCDLLANKSFKVAGLNLSLDLEVLNLLNRKNVQNVFDATGLTDNNGIVYTLDQFISTGSISDSIAYTWADLNADGFFDEADGEYWIMYPNPIYSKWRDLNADGEIDPYEKYTTYVAARNDYLSDPVNFNRVPNGTAYAGPRRATLALSFNF